MDEDIRFYTQRGERVAGPFTDDEIRDAVREGTFEPGTRVRMVGSDLWAAPHAWATFAMRRTLPELPPPPLADAVEPQLSAELLSASAAIREMLLWCVHEADRSFGPLTGEQIRRGLATGKYRSASVSLIDSDAWYPASLVFELPAQRAGQRSLDAERTGRRLDSLVTRDRAPLVALAHDASSGPSSAALGSQHLSMRCPTCLETIALSANVCPECGEPAGAASTASLRMAAFGGGPPSSGTRPGSIPDDRPDATWLRMHWRPLVTMGAMMAVVCTGVALRFLAPGRFAPERAATRQAGGPAAGCATPCWSGESCEKNACVWQRPGDVGHLSVAVHDAAGDPVSAAPRVSGPFALPKDVSDALLLDGDRFATALLTGTQIHDARSGEVLSLVSEAPQTRRLYRVGDVVYATAPQRIYVIDASTTRLLKTIELGASVGSVTVGASGRRALASLPSAHAVAVIATEFHAEIDRIQFGDDPVGPVGTDDTGKRALTTTGHVPLPGLQNPPGGAVYAFDPSRLASAQDRVRASVIGNPVSVLMTPDGEASYVAVRADNALVPLEWRPSGAVVQQERIPTCREPEQIELVRKGRRAIVRCNEGRAVEVFELGTGRVIRHVGLEQRAVDMAITPDGSQAIVALTSEQGRSGAVAIVDLDRYEVRTIPLDGEPTRVRLSPDGRTALLLSDRSKVAWVLR